VRSIRLYLICNPMKGDHPRRCASVFACEIHHAGTVTVTVTPTVSGKLALTANVSSVSYDPIATNNQASVSTSVSGSLFSPPPVVTQLSPALIQAGSNSFILTVDGEDFSSASTVLWNGQPLPTTLISGGQLTATVDASLVKQLGWSLISVSSAAPGGGQSSVLPFSVYQVLDVPANAMTFDPFTQNSTRYCQALRPTLAATAWLPSIRLPAMSAARCRWAASRTCCRRRATATISILV
jgi:hypothetical protein